ncbi:type VI secretion system amidase effector protein Tae4 [Burkholderia contaminans]|nr:T6SS effector amidase Tae4 family protein [Burkholderia contaminans]MCA8364030.1 type VI secretion system amidase effector protein Tae4 [Burkholderia contaminans]
MWRFSLVPCSGGWSWKPDSLGFHWRTAAFNLQLRLGHCRKAERVEYPPSNGGSLAGRQGVILFEVSGWSDAQGHATLFNGRTCYDHCYFNEPGARYRTDRANFWSLS